MLSSLDVGGPWLSYDYDMCPRRRISWSSAIRISGPVMKAYVWKVARQRFKDRPFWDFLGARCKHPETWDFAYVSEMVVSSWKCNLLFSEGLKSWNRTVARMMRLKAFSRFHPLSFCCDLLTWNLTGPRLQPGIIQSQPKPPVVPQGLLMFLDTKELLSSFKKAWLGDDKI